MRDRNVNRGELNIGPVPLPREHECDGDGAPIFEVRSVVNQSPEIERESFSAS